MILLEFRLETAKQGKCIGSGTGKTGEYLVLVQAANLFRGMLDHRLAQRNLAISCHDYVTVPADTKNCGGANQSLLVHLNNPSLYLARKVETGIKRGRFSRYVSFVESSSRLSSPPYRIKNSGFSSGSCRMISVQG